MKNIYKRVCPKCNISIKYTNARAWRHSCIMNSICKACAYKSQNRNVKISKSQLGKNNSFYGKKHSRENLLLYSKRSSGKNNPMYGIGGMRGKKHSIQSKLKQSLARKKYWKKIGIKPRSKFKKYRMLVDCLTSKQPIHLLKNYRKRGIAGKTGAYHLDHIISVYKGYHNNISVEDISNIKNLRFIPWLENQKKWWK